MLATGLPFDVEGNHFSIVPLLASPDFEEDVEKSDAKREMGPIGV